MGLERAVLVAGALLAVVSNLPVRGGAQETPPKPPLGLPPVAWPADNPYSAARVELGRYLFFDPRLSANGEVSCATCHPPEHAFAGGDPPPRGVTGKPLRRRAPTLINRAYGRSQFYDGRAATLEAQISGPISRPGRDGLPRQPRAVQAISKIAGYGPLFERAFGDAQVSFDRITKAIASFERTILSGNSPYDRFLSGDKQALSPARKRGLQIFERSGECSECHNGFNFTNEKFAGLGIGPDQKPPDFGLRGRSPESAATKGSSKCPRCAKSRLPGLICTTGGIRRSTTCWSSIEKAASRVRTSIRASRPSFWMPRPRRI